MARYTDRLERMQYEITPEDDNYLEELMQVAQSFRLFGEALAAFMVELGFIREESPKTAETYIKSRFENAGMPIPRSLSRWFSESVRPDRKVAFQICFALGLGFPAAQDFFRRVLLQRGVDCHDKTEAVYYFSLQNGSSYQEALDILHGLPVIDVKGKLETVFTTDIIGELDGLKTREELAGFLTGNAGWFLENNKTAGRFISRLWEEVTTGETCSVWETYLRILGLQKNEIKSVAVDRSLKSILKNDRLLHPLAQESFPDRQGLQLILRGGHVSYERVRKLMILLAFYSFWANKPMANGGDADFCLAEINRFLVDSSYPPLYAGNPYDWLFLFAMQDDYPLETFQNFMRELYAQKVEHDG